MLVGIPDSPSQVLEQFLVPLFSYHLASFLEFVCLVVDYKVLKTAFSVLPGLGVVKDFFIT